MVVRPQETRFLHSREVENMCQTALFSAQQGLWPRYMLWLPSDFTLPNAIAVPSAPGPDGFVVFAARL